MTQLPMSPKQRNIANQPPEKKKAMGVYEAITKAWRWVKQTMGRRRIYRVNGKDSYQAGEKDLQVRTLSMEFLDTQCEDVVDRTINEVDEVLDEILIMVCREENFLMTKIKNPPMETDL